jgi:hypothetical protein
LSSSINEQFNKKIFSNIIFELIKYRIPGNKVSFTRKKREKPTMLQSKVIKFNNHIFMIFSQKYFYLKNALKAQLIHCNFKYYFSKKNSSNKNFLNDFYLFKNKLVKKLKYLWSESLNFLSNIS